MIWQSVRIAFLVGAVALTGSYARADEDTNGGGDAKKDGKDAKPAVKMKTIYVMECVPEKYECKRTTYKTECRTEKVTCCKYECVPEVRERVCCVIKRVPEERWETRKVCTMVPCVEERTVMKRSYKYEQVTETVSKRVDRGHWECREVQCPLRSLTSRLGRGGCCDPCPAPTRTKKVWVSCWVTECCPVTRCKKVCVETPVKCKVTVCKPVWKEEKVKVCTYKCIEEKRVEKCTVMVKKKVAFETTRTVNVCVPHTETVWATRMVARCVARQVPDECHTVAHDACCQTRCRQACHDRCHRDRHCHDRCHRERCPRDRCHDRGRLFGHQRCCN